MVQSFSHQRQATEPLHLEHLIFVDLTERDAYLSATSPTLSLHHQVDFPIH